MIYTVHRSGTDSVVAACTSFDAAADRALEMICADFTRSPGCFTDYAVKLDGKEVGRFHRHPGRSDTVLFSPAPPDLSRQARPRAVEENVGRDYRYSAASETWSPLLGPSAAEPQPGVPRWVTIEEWQDTIDLHLREEEIWCVFCAGLATHALRHNGGWMHVSPTRNEEGKLPASPTHVLLPGWPSKLT